MMLQYFESLTAGLEDRLAHTTEGPRARKRFALEIARLGTRLFSPDQKVAWCGVLAPYDLLQALGVTSCFVEFVGAMLASTGGVPPFLEAAEQTGFSTDTCSYHRSVAGATEQGMMPEPDFLIATTAPCAGGMAVLEHLARRSQKPMFVIQVPSRLDDRAVDQLADQFRAMVAFVEQRTGTRLDPARLRATVEATNRARAAWLEVNRLAAAVPSPARRRDLVNFGIVMGLFLGTEAAVEIAELYRQEFAATVAAGQAGTTGERVRLMWLQNRIQFKNPIEAFLDELGAAVVLDELNDVDWEPVDPDDPYRGMAKRALSIPLCGPATRRVTNLQRLAGLYAVDGAINPCQWGCRQGTGARGLVEAGLRASGVPVANLEVDCVDPRSFAEGQLRTRLEAFVEMLAERKGA